MSIEWAVLLACGWLAATISGLVGFGGAVLLVPALAYVVGAKEAVPILTVAQLLGNLSRAGFGWREIQWRPALAFSAGAIPAGVLGARLFADLPASRLGQLIGVCLLGLVALRHTRLGRQTLPAWTLAPAGAAVGFLSAIAGTAGPLGAAIFLGLKLPPGAYVATEAVSAVFIHLAKGATYGHYALLTRHEAAQGVMLGGAMVLGSWTGRRLVGRIADDRYTRLVELLLVVTAAALILSSR